MKKTVTYRSAFARLLALALLFAQLAAAQPPQTGAQSGSQPAGAPATVEALRARLLAHVSQPRFAPASWGIKVVSLDTGKTLFEHNAEKYFAPASNAKLYTAALALDRLGADFRIRTSLYSKARPDASGTLKGDLIVYGRGDPTIAAAFHQGDYYRGLAPFVEVLANAGVRRVEGDLIGDESFFRGPRIGSGWEWDDLQWYYGAEVSALSINDNAIDLTVTPAERAGMPCRITTGPATRYVTIMNRTQTAPRDARPQVSIYRPVGQNVIYVSGRLPLEGRPYTGYVAVSNPAGLFVQMLKEALAARGIAVSGQARTIDWQYREVTPLDVTRLYELGFIQSPPLRDFLPQMLKPSQNLYAQLLLLQVGAMREAAGSEVEDAEKRASDPPGGTGARQPRAAGQPAPAEYATTEEAGVAAMNDFLAAAGVAAEDVLLEEGSGLSRRDLITPRATVELLKHMRRHRWGDIYFSALPVAGVDGTLKTRMKDSPAAANVRAKTGTLRYVHTLSGYVTTAAGERLAFSVMLNNYPGAGQVAHPRDEVDAVAVMLAQFAGRS